jgi:PAS domain-containing protein
MTTKIKSFTISPASIQGKLRISFIMTVSLFLLVMLVLLTVYQHLLKREAYLNTNIGAIKYFSIRFSNAVNKSYNDALAYAQYGQPHYRNEIMNTLRDEMTPTFDTLQQIGQQSEDVYTRNAIFEIEELFTKLREHYNALALVKPDEIEIFTKGKITPLMNKMNKEIDILTTTQIKKENTLRILQDNEKTTFTFILVSLLLIVLLTSYFISNRIIQTVMRNLDLLDSYTEILKHGNLPDKINVTQDELQDILDDIAYLTENLGRVKAFANDVGKGNFDTDITVFNNTGELGTALAEMRKSLKEISIQEKNRNWVNVGISQMSEIMRKHPDNISILTDELLANLVGYMHSSQGAIFVINENKILELKACYAYNRKKFVAKQIEIGEGLLGTTYQDGITQVITEIPKDYLEISSGLGKAAPKCVVLVPIKSQTETLGIMEIASFELLQAHQVEFLETVANIFASTITNILTNQRTKLLLTQAQNNAQRLQEQEELVRQKTEQLEATREELQKDYNELQREASTMRQTLNYINIALINIDSTGIVLFVNPLAAGIFDIEPTMLLQKSIFRLLPTMQEELSYMETNDLVEKVVYQNISSGRGRITPYQTTITKIAANKEHSFSLHFMKEQTLQLIDNHV